MNKSRNEKTGKDNGGDAGRDWQGTRPPDREPDLPESDSGSETIGNAPDQMGMTPEPGSAPVGRRRDLDPDPNPDASDGNTATTTTNVARECRDELLIDALARGFNYVDAGHRAGVSPRTITRRMTDTAFVAQVRRRRREISEQAAGALTNVQAEAVATIAELLSDPDSRIRLRAATALLTHAEQYRRQNFSEHFDAMDDRIADLETLAEELIQ